MHVRVMPECAACLGSEAGMHWRGRARLTYYNHVLALLACSVQITHFPESISVQLFEKGSVRDTLIAQVRPCQSLDQNVAASGYKQRACM